MPRVVRMLAHVETDLPRADITHVYLHGAAALRTDLTRTRTVPMSDLVGSGPDRRHRPARHVHRAWRCAGPGSRCCLVDDNPDHVRTASGSGAGRAAAGEDRPQLVVVAVPPDHLGRGDPGGARAHGRPWSPTSAA